MGRSRILYDPAMHDSPETQRVPLGLAPTIVGAIIGGWLGGIVGIELGSSMLDEPTRTSDNPLDDLFVNTFEVIFDVVFVAFITIAVICVGVAVGVYVALRLTKHRRAGTTALLCVALDGLAVPGAFVLAMAVDSVAPEVSLWAGLALLVLGVPLLARWGATRIREPAAENSL